MSETDDPLAARMSRIVRVKPEHPREPQPPERWCEFSSVRFRKRYRIEFVDRGDGHVEGRLFLRKWFRWHLMGDSVKFVDFRDGDQMVWARDTAIGWADDIRRYLEKGEM
jgi:hypothetical protein